MIGITGGKSRERIGIEFTFKVFEWGIVRYWVVYIFTITLQVLSVEPDCCCQTTECINLRDESRKDDKGRVKGRRRSLPLFCPIPPARYNNQSSALLASFSKFETLYSQTLHEITMGYSSRLKRRRVRILSAWFTAARVR